MSGGNNEKRKHHYIPVFHLAGFTKKGTKDSTLFMFDSETGEQRELKPKSVAFAKGLYSVDLPDTSSDVIEDIFMDLETKTAPVIRTLCETLRMPTGNDYNFLMNYIALLEVRTPRRREIYADFMEQISKITMQEVVATEERFEATRKRMEDDGLKVPQITYDKLRDFVFGERYSVTFDNTTHVRNVLESMDAVLQPLGARNWSVVYCPNTLGDFVCSDHPVSLHWIENRDRGLYSSPGHGLEGTEVTVPLTSRVLLIGRFQPYMPQNVILKTRLNLAYLNSFSSMYCNRFIFSRKEDFFWYTREEKIGTVTDFRRYIRKDKSEL